MYKLINAIPDVQVASVLKDDGTGTKLCIPMNPDNTDYQAYLAWVAEGNTPEPAETTE